MFKKIKSLFVADSSQAALARRTPLVGDPVWWAPKRAQCVVTETHGDGSFVFQGGEIVKNKRGRQVPRWTVAARHAGATWKPDLGIWIVGEGPTPKRGRDHTVVYPEPVAMSGTSRGSFAVEN